MSNQGATQAMGLEDFLDHSTRGPQAAYLDNWKKRNPPQINVVLHTRSSIIALWAHPWPRIMTREKDGKETREVWSGEFNSWETQDVLQKQYKRDDSSGVREYPPQICPMSIMLEEVDRHLRSGAITWDQALFRFVGDDPTKAKVLHAAGMLNRTKLYWDQLDDREKKDALRRGLSGPKDSWKENMQAKCQYLFSVVDYDDIQGGVQITTETTLVGDKMKKAIRDRMASLGEEKGHPFKHPVCFQWRYVANATQFNDKYDVLAIEKFTITPAIRELIVDKDPPDLSRKTMPGDIVALRASMEDSYCGPEGLLDWDFIFGKAEAMAGVSSSAGEDDDPEETAEDIAANIAGTPEEEQEPEVEEPVKEPAKAAPAATPAPAAPKPAARARKAATPPPDPRYVVATTTTDENGEHAFAADGCEIFTCDTEDCGTVMRADEDVCKKCGAQYEVEAQEPEHEAAKPAPAAAKPAVTSKGTAAPAAAKEAKGAGRDRLGF